MLYFATFCALSVTLGALLFNLTHVLNEYFALQQQLANKPKVRVTCWCKHTPGRGQAGGVGVCAGSRVVAADQGCVLQL